MFTVHCCDCKNYVIYSQAYTIRLNMGKYMTKLKFHVIQQQLCLNKYMCIYMYILITKFHWHQRRARRNANKMIRNQHISQKNSPPNWSISTKYFQIPNIRNVYHKAFSGINTTTCFQRQKPDEVTFHIVLYRKSIRAQHQTKTPARGEKKKKEKKKKHGS